MSRVIYNNVEISLVKTNMFSREPIFSDDGVDYLYTHFVLDVSGIVNPNAGSYGFDEFNQLVPIAGSSTVFSDVKLRHLLLQPRRQLVYMISNQFMLVSPLPRPDNKGYLLQDAKNGPIPQVYSITRVDGDKTFHVNFRVETFLNECQINSQTDVRALISNRFEQSDYLDSDNGWLTVRTTSGRATLRTDILSYLSKNPDEFRRQVLPPVAYGMQRTSVQVSVPSDATSLSYQVTDREKYYDLGDTEGTPGGSGILNAEVEFSSSTVSGPEGQLNGWTVAEMAIAANGKKEASHWIMLQQCFKIAQAKLPLDKMPDGAVLSHVAVREILTDRKVFLRIQMRLAPSNVGKISLLNTDVLKREGIFPELLGVNPGPPKDGGTRGSFDKALLTSRIATACQPIGKPTSVGPKTSSGTAIDYDGELQVPVTVTYTDVLPATNPKYSYGQQSKFHTDYRLNYKYHRKLHRHAVPIAKNPQQKNTNSGGTTGGTTGGTVNGFAAIGFAGVTDPGTSPTSGTNPDGTPSEPPLVPDNEIVVLAAPQTSVMIEWTAERVGSMPSYPNPYTMEQNFVLMDDRISPMAPVLSANGVDFIYRVVGVYTFALLSSRGTGDVLPMGALPMWDKFYEDSRTNGAYDLKDGIIGPTPSQNA